MTDFFKWLWSGFGLGGGFRGIGMALATLLGVFFVAYLAIRWVVRLCTSKKSGNTVD